MKIRTEEREVVNRIINLKHEPGAVEKGAVRIDRRTRWGNPFLIGRDGDRALSRRSLAAHPRGRNLAGRACRPARQGSGLPLRSRALPWRSARPRRGLGGRAAGPGGGCRCARPRQSAHNARQHDHRRSLPGRTTAAPGWARGRGFFLKFRAVQSGAVGLGGNYGTRVSVGAAPPGRPSSCPHAR